MLKTIKKFLSRKKEPTTTRSLGKNQEQRAWRYLKNKGWTLLEENFVAQHAEIDLICRDPQGSIVFVEVKFRRDSRLGRPEEAVTLKKQQHLSRAAIAYVKQNQLQNNFFRFDVIALTDSSLLHHPNAFQIDGWTF